MTHYRNSVLYRQLEPRRAARADGGSDGADSPCSWTGLDRAGLGGLGPGSACVGALAGAINDLAAYMKVW